ncbi:MAG TPA: 4Fe-4S dicluster domain-containing protein [Bacteroidales bacterium]|jgi:heterodisulfide reductase subunit C|nr:MAG: succinate dehydrogenase/fumarate reductase iron-sulfur subunit [Bacteroidetes bacterium ADurb.Bin012]HNQ60420.1 4Fe-4S dicluster domain-containing protein [Bacteroidales bacterium]HNU22103.1 4Fe-4S dicluster domain-containing protein [Bacteroidales bacterium]HOX79908.1 4Fe-4S dicluster domain-containing protein [Bacteroidales bacterium]HPC14036.1 4Fe-4S dicluster domain-containing protein [Bacteroidales bacterium]
MGKDIQMIPMEEIYADPRIRENMNACINCGVCTALCPAADYYDYEPRYVERIILMRNADALEELMSSDYIWYCGQCMSCKARCPRQNAPGMVVSALRYWSQKLGLFVRSPKGRQQLIIKQNIGRNIYDLGYCVHPSRLSLEEHPEQGPVWQWILDNIEKTYALVNANIDKDGPGPMRKIPDEALQEIRSVLQGTGAIEFWKQIETKVLEYNNDDKR